MMHEAPTIIGGARVVLYTPIDQSHRPTGGCRHIVSGVIQGPAAGLAICQYDDDPAEAYYLFGCDEHWNTLSDTWHQSLRDAMRQAEFEYAGVWQTWLNHQPAWEPLNDGEQRAAWDLFDEQFGFRPGVDPSTWPAIREPTPSVTYDVAHAFGGGDNEGAMAELNVEMFTLFKGCVPPAERLYALDWQHPCYRFNPFGRFVFSEVYDGMIPVLPDGDYSIFLAEDFSYGTFGHPWEQTICVFGQPLLEVVEREQPTHLGRASRRNGNAV